MHDIIPQLTWPSGAFGLLIALTSAAILYLAASLLRWRLQTVPLPRAALTAGLWLLGARLGSLFTDFQAYQHAWWHFFVPWLGDWSLMGAIGLTALFVLLTLRRNRSVNLRLAISMAASIAAWACLSIGLTTILPSARFSSITLTDLHGQTVKFPDMQDRPIVVNMWASWCPPCRKELPLLARAANKHPEIHFVFVDEGQNGSIVRHYLKAHNLHLRHVLLDEKRVLTHRLKVPGYPDTLFLNPQGHLVRLHTGIISHSQLAKDLRRLGKA